MHQVGDQSGWPFWWVRGWVNCSDNGLHDGCLFAPMKVLWIFGFLIFNVEVPCLTLLPDLAFKLAGNFNGKF